MVTYFRKYFHYKLLLKQQEYECKEEKENKDDKINCDIISKKLYIIKMRKTTLFLGEWNVFILVANIKSKIKINDLKFL